MRQPVRYNEHDPRFGFWVRAECVTDGIPMAAAELLIAQALADVWDVYPNVVSGNMIICAADLHSWCAAHPGREPRMSLSEWWKEYGND